MRTLSTSYAGPGSVSTSGSITTKQVCHIRVYFDYVTTLHPAKAIEYMLIDAVLAAEPYLKIAEQIENPKQYVYLTDDIKLRIQSTTEPVSAPESYEYHY